MVFFTFALYVKNCSFHVCSNGTESFASSIELNYYIQPLIFIKKFISSLQTSQCYLIDSKKLVRVCIKLGSTGIVI